MGIFTEPPVKGVEISLDRGCAARVGARGYPAAADGGTRRQCVSVNVEGREVFWDTLMIGRTLFVEVPSNMLMESSRTSFVSLLELAEEELCCSKVVVCFKKNHRDRDKLIQAFKFMGFELATVAAGVHHLTASVPSDVMYLSYCVESSDSSDTDDESDMSE